MPLAFKLLSCFGLINLLIFGGFWLVNVGVGRPVQEFYEGRRVSDVLSEIVLAQERHYAVEGGYWISDIAGLPALDPAIAGADDRLMATSPPPPLVGPKDGYWFRSLPFARPSTERFAVLALPAIREAGTFMYIVREDGVVWRKSEVAGGVDVFPADPATEGWVRVPR